MNKLYYIIVLCFLMFSATQLQAQEYRFKTSGFMVSQKSKGKWSDFSKFKKSEMIVVLDTNKDRIVVYSEAIQLFTILEYREQVKTKTNDIAAFTCVDNLGTDCVLSIYTRKDKNNLNQLYIYYNDMILVYNMKLIKEKKDS